VYIEREAALLCHSSVIEYAQVWVVHLQKKKIKINELPMDIYCVIFKKGSVVSSLPL
jgi:hypothetical protein